MKTFATSIHIVYDNKMEWSIIKRLHPVPTAYGSSQDSIKDTIFYTKYRIPSKCETS